jgi:hypothetical protein
MPTFLERYQAGEHAAVWDELMSLGDAVRHEPYYKDAAAVANETMRRARHNVELLIQRLDAMGYRFLDTVASAEDRLSQLDVMNQIFKQVEDKVALEPGRYNVHSLQIVEAARAMKAKTAPLLEKLAAKAGEAAASKRKPALEDAHVFDPPDRKTPQLIKRLEQRAGGPLPLSLQAWYEQVGGVSLMGSHPVLNPADFSNRNVLNQFESLMGSQPIMGSRPIMTPPPGEETLPDPLVIGPLEELLGMDELLGGEDAEQRDPGHKLQLMISPDDLHKANISGDAYYITLPDARADFQFDDWHRTTFVNYLRITFQWGGFPGWERSPNPPHKEISQLSLDLLPL